MLAKRNLLKKERGEMKKNVRNNVVFVTLFRTVLGVTSIRKLAYFAKSF